MKKNRKIRIVDICAYFTSPPLSGGQERVHFFNKELSAYHEIEQFSFTPVISLKKSFRINGQYTEQVKNPFAYTLAVILLKWLGIRNYDFIIPFAFRFVIPGQEFRRALHKADLIQVEHPWLVHFASKYTDKPIILVEHNVEIELQRNFFKNNILKSLIMRSIIRTEKKALETAGLVFAMCQEDRQLMTKLYSIPLEKIDVVPNGTDTTDGKSGKLTEHDLKKGSQKTTIIFIGSNHPPNKDAAEWIETELAPKLPKCNFIIAGDVRRPGRRANILCTGKVKDIDEYLKTATIAVNPVSWGSGTNLKTIRYMMQGLPVVTTAFGARGLAGTRGKDYIIAERKNFHKELLRLTQDRASSKLIGQNGKKLGKKYEWKRIVKSALGAYSRIQQQSVQGKRLRK